MARSISRNETELDIVRGVAASGRDEPVLMLNLNCYSPAAGFPDGELYKEYMSVLDEFLPVVGGKVLWRHRVLGQVVGEQALDEVLAAWYPTHQAFLELPTAPGAEENFRLRGLAVEYAVIHRFAGDVYPFEP